MSKLYGANFLGHRKSGCSWIGQLYWNGSSLLRSFCLSDKYVCVNFNTFVISAQNALTSLVIHDPGCGSF